ncbi:CHAP domain-containing protein [Cryobacterium cryoconiti]|uniref:CHAP domain-containing protein n=1 Tax=Cryobacterium cryoconiti TaxID=1259239 RepID=A0A4Y8JUF9_9MICO|nr:CHAP domain-containing protein [Cryobacterium cryoconiti]TFD30675.1 CHAP domain-containing protein [Cryobacterium cryoconiti]
MPYSGVPGTPGSPETPISVPSRRELRAQREAAEAQADATVSTPVNTDGPAVASATVALPPAETVAVDVASLVARPGRLNPVPPQAHRAAASRPVRTSRVRRPLKIAVTLLAIPGMFLTAGLPAYAFSPAGDVASTSTRVAGETQGVTVASGAAAITVARDGFTATTSEELAQRDADALAAKQAEEAAASTNRSASADFAVYTVRAKGDDYPWFDQATDDQGGGLSPLGYYYRECVDFVAWRLNRDAGSTGSPWSYTWSSLTPSGGNASNWASAWAGHGWATGDTPVVGAVAWFNYNHVAYVQSINSDGSVMLEEYNWNSSHAYHTRTVSPSEVPLFLYPPT